MTENITTLNNLATFVDQIVAQLESHEDRATVLVLLGDLGAGKTTLVQHLGRVLGVTDVITSPTYTIMQSYELRNGLFDVLVHMDAYRIDTLDELEPLRFKELLSTPRTLVCIEWGSKVQAALPEVDCTIELTVTADGIRTGTILTA